jgi:hypothetical protein
LDDAFGFTKSGNSEIAVAWYELAIRHKPADGNAAYATTIMPDIERFLTDVGRRKFLLPLYRAMKESGQLAEARRIFATSKQNYHSVSVGSLEELLASGD